MKISTTLACLLLFLLAAPTIKAQQTVNNATVSGAITATAQPLIAATINLLRTSDSSLAQTTLSDTTGQFTIANVHTGKYLLRVTTLGYKKYYSQPFTITPETGQYRLPDILLTTDSRNLNTVEVTSRKPLIEHKLDRTIVNVDASPSTSSMNAMEIMERLPGVTLDKDGNITLKGRSGVLVLIDDKPTYLSPSELSTLLSGMPGANLNQVEIMTTAPANYDAAGTGGVINIKTKKIRSQGLNGSVTVGGGIGRFPRSNNSFNLNYHMGKVNLFASYGYNYRKYRRDFDLKRNLYDSTGKLSQVFDQHTRIENGSNAHTAKLGMDLDISKRTAIGLIFNGAFNNSRAVSSNTTDILNPMHVLDSVVLAPGNERTQFNNSGVNIDIRHSFDSAGRTLSASIDYQHYHATDDQQIATISRDNQGISLHPDDLLIGDLPSTLNIYSAKVDYVHPLANQLKLEAGVKTSYVKTDNDAGYQHLTEGNYIVDNNLSNHFIYSENINAGYFTLSKKFNSHWEGKAGLRVENTNAKGDQLATDQSFVRHYTRLFPTAYLGYELNSNNQFSLSYGRRLERPNYQDMNPFLYFLDKYTYEAGNPLLQPQFSHNVELNHTWHSILTSTLSYSRTTDIITDVIKQVDSSKITFETYGNLATTNQFTASVSLDMPLTKWWETSVYVEGYHKSYKGIVNDKPFDADANTFSTNITNRFKLWETWTFELSGYYYSQRLIGTNVARPSGSMNFAASKQVLKKKGTIKLSIRDFANLSEYNGFTRYQNVDLTVHNKYDTRIFSLAFTYRFSKGKAGKRYEHNAASSDEQSRVKEGSH